MAIQRQYDKCPQCGEPLKPIHKDMGKNFIGDTFSGMYERCKCQQPVQEREEVNLPVDAEGNQIVGQFEFNYEKGEVKYTSFLPAEQPAPTHTGEATPKTPHPSKPFIVANVREVFDRYEKEEISFSRMVEIMNEMVEQWQGGDAVDTPVEAEQELREQVSALKEYLKYCVDKDDMKRGEYESFCKARNRMYDLKLF